MKPCDELEGVKAQDEGWVIGEPGADDQGDDEVEDVGESGQ